MDNKNTTLLGIGLAALTVGLGYLGYVVVSNNSGDNISVERSGPETEKIKVEAKDVTDSISLEEETVGKLKVDEKADKVITFDRISTTIGGSYSPVLMSGPCSIESELAIHQSAAVVAAAIST